MQFEVTKEERFNEIYRTFQNDIYRISLYYAKDTHAAEDIAQKVFYQFYLHFEHVNQDNVRAYLIRSARNMSFNWLRDRKQEVSGEYLDVVREDDACFSAEDEYIRNEQNQKKEELVEILLECLRKENESWYQIVNLIYCLEKPHEEVAAELGLTRDVLYSKLYRAKKWMRKHFEQEYKEL